MPGCQGAGVQGCLVWGLGSGGGVLLRRGGGAAFHFTIVRIGGSGIVFVFYQIKLLDSDMRITNWSYKSSDLLNESFCPNDDILRISLRYVRKGVSGRLMGYRVRKDVSSGIGGLEFTKKCSLDIFWPKEMYGLMFFVQELQL